MNQTLPDTPDVRITQPRRISAAEQEANKTAADRAEDVAYTINHAFACTGLDLFIAPFIGDWTQEHLGRRINIGCDHDHGHDHHDHHGHDHHDHDHDHDHHHHDHHDHHGHDHYESHLKHWFVGEFIGDFGAVPLTIGIQRHAPWFMRSLSVGMEAIMGGVFRGGAERTARTWANENGVSTDSPEFKERVESIYRHEIDHLPQALMWTVTSTGVNIASQRYLMHNHAPMSHLLAGKSLGVGISTGAVIAGRALFPGAMRKWDQFTGDNIFLPLTKSLGGLVGIDSETVDRMAQKQRDGERNGWVSQTQEPDQSAAAAR